MSRPTIFERRISAMMDTETIKEMHEISEILGTKHAETIRSCIHCLRNLISDGLNELEMLKLIEQRPARLRDMRLKTHKMV